MVADPIIMALKDGSDAGVIVVLNAASNMPIVIAYLIHQHRTLD